MEVRQSSSQYPLYGAPMGKSNRVRYSRWDGTQVGFELDATDIFSEITDDLLYHGDLNAALRRMMQTGFQTPDGQRMQGMREMLEKLRKKRREALENHSLGDIYDDIARELREVVATERDALDAAAQQAQESGDPRRRELTDQANAERHAALDLLSPDLAGMVRDLQNYEFASPEARERFEQLVDRLREQLMQQYVDQMTGAVEGMTPEDMSRMKDMFAELNQMLEARQRGEEPDFDGFMERFGDFFPENPQNLDELLEQMAQRMAAMQAMLNSMTPEQRAQLQQLSDQLLDDMDLRWQMEQLAGHLQALHGELDWGSDQGFTGSEPMGFGRAMQAVRDLQDLEGLEQMLGQATSPAALSEVDLERLAELAGPDAAQSLGRLAELTKLLEEAGLIDQRDGRLSLTPAAIRLLGADALRDLFGELRRDLAGQHALDALGNGHERAPDSRAYQYGDPFNLDLHRTLRNAVRRGGPGLPIRLSPDDFEIEQMEHQTRASTVLLLDLSMSMPMRGNFLPAKKVAIALHHLIATQYPRDFLGLVGFGETARELRPESLPEASWDFAYGTNMHHALALARRLLDGRGGSKQVIMVTDGEPTAHVTARGDVYFHYPPARETVEATIGEVRRCTRAGITINTFMLDADSGLQHFVERMATINGGRAFFTTHETLGGYVLVDFLEHRRRVERRGRRAG